MNAGPAACPVKRQRHGNVTKPQSSLTDPEMVQCTDKEKLIIDNRIVLIPDRIASLARKDQIPGKHIIERHYQGSGVAGG